MDFPFILCILWLFLSTKYTRNCIKCPRYGQSVDYDVLVQLGLNTQCVSNLYATASIMPRKTKLIRAFRSFSHSAYAYKIDRIFPIKPDAKFRCKHVQLSYHQRMALPNESARCRFTRDGFCQPLYTLRGTKIMWFEDIHFQRCTKQRSA